jgi:hypothetical protein
MLHTHSNIMKFPLWQVKEDLLNWEVHPHGKNGGQRFGQWFINKHSIQEHSTLFYIVGPEEAYRYIINHLVEY